MCLNTKSSLQAIRRLVVDLRNGVLMTSCECKLLAWSLVIM
jgi:hypothetical protein